MHVNSKKANPFKQKVYQDFVFMKKPSTTHENYNLNEN